MWNTGVKYVNRTPHQNMQSESQSSPPPPPQLKEKEKPRNLTQPPVPGEKKIHKSTRKGNNPHCGGSSKSTWKEWELLVS